MVALCAGIVAGIIIVHAVSTRGHEGTIIGKGGEAVFATVYNKKIEQSAVTAYDFEFSQGLLK